MGTDPIAPKARRQKRRERIRKQIRDGVVPEPPDDPIKFAGWSQKHYPAVPTKTVLGVANSVKASKDDAKNAMDFIAQRMDITPNMLGFKTQRKDGKWLTPGGKVVSADHGIRIFDMHQEKTLRRMLASASGDAAAKARQAQVASDEGSTTLIEAAGRAQKGDRAPKAMANIIEGYRTGLPQAQLEVMPVEHMLTFSAQAASMLKTKKQRNLYTQAIAALRDDPMEVVTKHMYAMEAASAGFAADSPAGLFKEFGLLSSKGELVMNPEEVEAKLRADFKPSSAGSSFILRQHDGQTYAWNPWDLRWELKAEGDANLLLGQYNHMTGTYPPETTSDPSTWTEPNEVDTPSITGGFNDLDVKMAGFIPLNMKTYEADVLYADLSERLAQYKEDFDIRKASFEKSTVGKVFHHIDAGWDFLYHKGVGGSVLVANTFLKPFVSKKQQEGGAAAGERIFSGDSTYAEELVNQGVDPVAAAALDFVVSTATDPTVIAGKVLHGARAVSSLPELAEAGRGLARGSTIYEQTIGRFTRYMDEEGNLVRGLTKLDTPAEQFGGIMAKAYTAPKRYLGNKSWARRLTEVSADEKITDTWSWAHERMRTATGRDAISPEMATVIDGIVSAGVKEGRSIDELEPIVGQALMASTGTRPMSKQVLDAIVRKQPYNLTLPKGRSQTFDVDIDLHNSRATRAELDQVAAHFAQVGDDLIGNMLQEVPHRKMLRGVGKDADGIIAEQVRRLKNNVPASEASAEGGKFQRQFQRTSLRAKVWNKTQREYWAREARLVSDVAAPDRGKAMFKLVNRYDRETFSKIAATKGLSPEDTKTLWNKLQDEKLGTLNRQGQAFGVQYRLVDGEFVQVPATLEVEGGTIVAKALAGNKGAKTGDGILATQEVNSFPMVDPNIMRQRIRQHLDIRDRQFIFWSKWLNKPIKRVPDISEAQAPSRLEFLETTTNEAAWDRLAVESVDLGAYDSFESFYAAAAKLKAEGVKDIRGTMAADIGKTRELVEKLPIGKIRDEKTKMGEIGEGLIAAMDSWQSKWKTLQVARLGYVPRIVMDEQVRYLTDLGISARIASSKLGRKFIKRQFTDELEFVTPSGEVLRVERNLPFVDGPIEPFVNTNRHWDQIYESLYRNARLKNGGVQRYWTRLEATKLAKRPVKKGRDVYIDGWKRAFDQQANDMVGRATLRGLKSGDELDEITRAIVKELRTTSTGKSYVKRMGHNPDELEDIVEDHVHRIAAYTMGDRSIAAAALNRESKVLDKWMKTQWKRMDSGMPSDQGFKLPDIHGQDRFDSGNIPAIGRNIVDKWTAALMQDPSNQLSRQPFARAWKDRMYRAQWDVFKSSGVKVTNADELARLDDYFQAGARRFAIERTNKIMFDMAEQSRFAELSRFVVPFMQPYFEFLQVYSHLIRKNPALIGYARNSFKFLKDSGWAQQNEYGDWEVNMKYLKHLSPVLLAMTGKMPSAVLAAGAETVALVGDSQTHFEDEDEFGFFAPLSGFNMFTGSSLPADAVGLGAVFGNMGIPMPGLSPAALAMAQLAYKEKPGSGISAWLYEYGSMLQNPQTFTARMVAPRWGINLVQAFAPDVNIDPIQRDKYKFNFLILGQKTGALDGKNKTQINAWVDEQVRDFYLYKTWQSMVSPAAVIAKFPTKDLKDEWYAIMEKHGQKDYEGAYAEWTEKYPDYWMVPISNTFWTNEQGKDDRPELAAKIPKLIPTELTDMVLGDPKAKAYADAFPELTFAMLGAIGAQEYEDWDQHTYTRWLASGKLKVRSVDEGLDAGASQARYFEETLVREKFKAWLNGYDGSTTDIAYENRVQARDKELREIAQKYTPFQTTPNEVDVSNGVSGDAIELIETAIADKRTMEFPFGRLLKEWWGFRAQTAEKLRAMGASDINTELAADLLAEYKARVDGLRDGEQGELFGAIYDIYFGGRDLSNVTSEYEQVVKNYPAASLPWAEQTQANIRALKLQTNENAPDELTRSQGYAAQAEAVNKAYVEAAQRGLSKEQNPVHLWYLNKDARERNDLQLDAAFSTYQYLDRFEREVLLGETTNQTAEDHQVDLAKYRAWIAQQKAAGQPSTALYAQMDAWIQQTKASDPVFAKQVENANTWGYSFFKVLGPQLTTQEGRTGESWRTVQELTGAYQAAIEGAGLHGQYGEDKALYTKLRNQFRDDIETLQEDNPEFGRQWDSLESSNYKMMTDAFFPPIWYRLGG